jgi:hypothetical protein
VREQIKDRVTLILAAALIAMVMLEAAAIPHYSPEFPWHRVPGYAAFIGLAGCIVVVLLSKWLGRTFLQRPEAND